MFSRAFAAAIVALPLLATAVPTDVSGGQCNVGQVNCCNQVQQVQGSIISTVAGLLGIPLNLLPLLGFDCSPITAIGVAGNSCTAQPVCCQKNQITGLVNALNCSPVNINL